MKEVYKGIYAVDDLNGITLEDIFFNATDAIFVTDGEGRVLLVEEEVQHNMGLQVSEIIGEKVDNLVKRGAYSRSTCRECINTKKPVNGLLKTQNGRYMFSSTKPIFNKDGSIRFTVTNTRDYGILESFVKELENEVGMREKYKNILNYLQEVRTGKEQPLAKSSAMKHVLRLCESIAKSDSVVLITGETGTGKEVCAEYIFQQSHRNAEPFLPINCSAIPKDLLESELFGYEKGAFTGAYPKGRVGLIEMASHGTIFLDEIGELPLHVQPKLLRFLENGEIKRVGSSKQIPVDVRIISATNRDLKKMVHEGLFREDLYYRLNVVPIFLPPLRERKEDILLLANHFLSRFNYKYGKAMTLSESIIEGFLQYRWPGNIRELRNIIERFVVTGDENFAGIYPTPKETEAILPERREKDAVIIPLKQAAREFESEYILRAVNACGGNITKAAELLSIHRTLIYKKGVLSKE